MRKIFILSPAKTSGKRAELLFSPKSKFDLAVRLRRPDGVPVGEVFSFLSGLYFRGKLEYVNHFGSGENAAFVITSDAGLVEIARTVNSDRLAQFGNVNIDPNDVRYSAPLHRSASELVRDHPNETAFILLGSISSPKYVPLLLEHFKERLYVPAAFIGRGDMSRGGLLLRAVRENRELEYVQIVRCGWGPKKKRPGPAAGSGTV